MEAAAAAASAAAAAAEGAAMAASVAAAAAAKEAVAAAVTAKEATDAAKDAAAAASAAALNAKQAAAAASAAALSAKEAAVRASAAALDVKEAAAVAATAAQAATAAAAAMQASRKRRFADAALDAEEAAPAAGSTAGQAAGPINAKEAAPAVAIAGQAVGPINAEEAAPLAANAWRPAAAAVVAATQASKKRKSAAVALNYRVPAPATVTAGETAAAALQASNECKFQIIDVDQDPPGSGDVDDAGSVDHIGRLPDAVLCSIVSLLPTKEGARTQVISRRWRPLWHSAPLNLVVNQELKRKNHNLVHLISKRNNLISKILSVHPGPARRFSLCLSNSNYHGKMEGWLSSHALDKLQEFELIPDHWFSIRGTIYLLPSSVYRFAPTLRVAKFGGCRFSNSIVKPSLKFPCLKQLTLDRVTISEDALHSMLSGCYALESLELKKNSGFRRLCISSQTLKSVGFCTNWFTNTDPLQELVIEDAPCLERLLALDPQVGPRTIRVILAPKLNILGALSKSTTELQLGTTVFQSMIAVGLTTKMHSVRVLVLEYTNLDIVVNFLKCFPCLERLYAFFRSRMCISNPREYDPPEPIQCLELHLKEVLLRNYNGNAPLFIDFAKFFVLNAKVLKEMKITLRYHRQYNWFAHQHQLLRTKDRISQDARIELKCGTNVCFTDNMNTHDLSMADPFDVPSSGCKRCSGSPF